MGTQESHRDEHSAAKEQPRDGAETAPDESTTSTIATTNSVEELRVASEAVAAEASAPSVAPMRPAVMHMRGGLWVKPSDPGFASALRGVARNDGIAVDGSAAAEAAAEAEEVNREAVLESIRGEQLQPVDQSASSSSAQEEDSPSSGESAQETGGRGRGRFRSLRDEMR